MQAGFLILSSVLAIYVAAYNVIALVMVAVAGWQLWRRRTGDPQAVLEIIEGSVLLPGITIVVPAYNEEAGILRTVRSLVSARYPDLEIIVVNDGSRDSTLASLRASMGLQPSARFQRASLPTAPVRAVYRSPQEPGLLVIDKRNGGKADALNCGINFASRELVCIIDADIVISPDALLHLVRPFLEDTTTVATSGTIRPLNGCQVDAKGRVTPGVSGKPLAVFQTLEYCRAFTLGRLFFNLGDAHLIISGAFGLFRRDLLVAVGGYQAYAIGEDMEIVVRTHSYLRNLGQPYRIVSVPEAVLYTEVPGSVQELGRQRTRWHQGLLTTIRLHRTLLFNPRYGYVGMFAFPYYLLFELLSPFSETLGWLLLPVLWALHLLTANAVLPFFVAATLLSTLVSIFALLIDSLAFDHLSRFRHRLLLLAAAVVEPFGYHQLCLFFRLRAFPRFYGSVHFRSGWVPPTRAGATAAPDARAT